jgi:hypothetical protein
MAWWQSFGKKENAKKAVVERGWYVLTYFLLDDKRLLRCTTSSEVEVMAKVGSVYGFSNSSNNDDDMIDVNDMDDGELLEMRRVLKSINRTGDPFLLCLVLDYPVMR